MKKTKFIVSFLLFCIMLSLFSICFAADIEVYWPNMNGNESLKQEDGYTQAVMQNANYNLNFECQVSGLYAISSFKETNGTTVSGQYHKYTISQTTGASSNPQQEFKSTYLRIPALKTSDGSGGDVYTLFSNPTSNGNTTVYVWLDAGHSYALRNLDSHSIITIKRAEHGEKLPSGMEANYDDIYISQYSTEGRTRGQSTAGDIAKTSKDYEKNDVPASAAGKIRTPDDKPVTGIEAIKSKNAFEEAFVSLLLSCGDFTVNLLDKIVGEDVTISLLIFNKVKATNANFFDATARESGLAGAKIGEIINDWYQTFKALAIAFYLVCLLSIGVHVLLNSTAGGLQKARELFSEWAKGVIILFLMPLAMKWVFTINEALIKSFQPPSVTDPVGSGFQSGQDWSLEEIEFRSPSYISKYTGKISFGSSQTNNSYMSKIDDYKKNLDLMRVMRAYAGATGKLGYTLLWFILIGQLLVFIFLYYKRYFMLAFLVAVFPVTCIFNAISIMQGKRGPQMSVWFKEFVTNVFTQFIHAIIYTIISSVIITIVKDSLVTGSSGAANWVIIIVCINFVPEGERIIKKLISKIGSGKSAGGLQGSASGLKGMYHNAVGNVKQIMGSFKD